MPLPDPVGEQLNVLTYSPHGHLVVLGTAGSGKTTMAIHRAVRLADKSHNFNGRTLLLTYNNSLITYLRFLRPEGFPNIDLHTYHGFALGYLNHRGLMGRSDIVKDPERRNLIRAALREVRANTQLPDLDRPLSFFEDEINFIQKNGYGDFATYLDVERRGRGEQLRKENERPFVFEVFEKYRELRADAEYRYDYNDVATTVREQFMLDDSDRQYTHVVIDEGQDFSPEMLRSVALAVPEDGSLTFFGDVAQQIYGRDVRWRDSGLEIGSKGIRRFTKNYRNSGPIASLALALSQKPYFTIEADLVEPEPATAEGPKPAVTTFETQAEELAFVKTQALNAAATNTVGVLCRSNSEVQLLQGMFPGAQRVNKYMGVWEGAPGISFGTVHQMKGLEFGTVILMGASAEAWPDPVLVERFGEEEAEISAGKLLYVAITRAQQNLIITSVGHPTQLLPTNEDLWIEIGL